MGELSVLKEVYTVNDDCDETENKIAISIDDFDPICSNLLPWTMTPQVSNYCSHLYFLSLIYISMINLNNICLN